MGSPPRNRLFYRPLLADVQHVVTNWERNLSRWRWREVILSLALTGAVVAGCGGILWLSAKVEQPPYSPRSVSTQAAVVTALEERGALVVRDRSWRITRVVVEHPAFDDADLALLAGLPELQTVLLVGCPVTDAGVVTLRTLPKLQSVHLIDSRVTDRGSRALQDAMPQALVRVERTTGE